MLELKIPPMTIFVSGAIFLISFTVRLAILFHESVKSALVTSLSSSNAICLVQIYNDIKTVLFAPADTAFNVSHSAFDDFAVIRLDNIVIYRHTDVIKSHCRYLFNILFGYEGGIMLVIVLGSHCEIQPPRSIPL